MHNIHIIIGITGTHGAGKGTLVEYLKRQGFIHFSAREYLQDALRREGKPLDRPHLNSLANALRKMYGSAHVAFVLYEKASIVCGSSVIESIYTVSEIEKIRAAADFDKKKFILVAVDADQRLRYQRVSENRKSETDNITFEEFQTQEALEMSSTDPESQNLLACRDRANVLLRNNGTVEEFHAQIMERLGFWLR
jgi:dephospho-CoA kinase